MRTNFKFFKENEPDVSLEDLIDVDDMLVNIPIELIEHRDVAVPDENNPAYYDTDEFTFIGVSTLRWEGGGIVYKRMMFMSKINREIIEGNIIHLGHPMWNCTDRNV